MSDMENILALSDEEVLALGPVAFADQPAATTEPEPQPTPEEQDKVVEPEPEPQPDPVEEDPTPDEVVEDDPTPVTEPAAKDAPSAKEPAAATTEQVPEQKTDVAQPASDDYTEEKGKAAIAQLAKLYSTFKASGRDIKIDSVEEAIPLMQKGVNYHDKMAGLKPSLNIVRMLEREGLLDEGKLGFLIDLSKKNPEAIAKLVKDSGIDVLDIDDKKVASYKPGDYALSKQEAALEDVMTDLRGSASFDRVIQFASKQVDQDSKQLIVEKPQLLKLFANQIESGVFDIIWSEVTKQKALGKLDGLNDLEAYDAVGKHLNSQGRFNQPAPQQQPAPTQPQVAVAPKAQKPVDPAVAAAKAAAAPSKSRPTTSAAKPAFNPLAMSDEEFEKQFKQSY